MNELPVDGKIREAMVAGIFYPEEPAELRRAVAAALDAAAPARRDAIAVMSPHAGFEYSGAAQAVAWKAASGRTVRRVVILAPLHRSRDLVAYLPESARFQTPLGDVTVDMDLCAELESCGTVFSVNDIPHMEEHAVEVQLPFMKLLFPDACLVPLLISGNGASLAASLSRSLDLVLGQDLAGTLLVVSTNLASSMMPAEAKARSDGLLDRVSRGDWHAIAEEQGPDERQACGASALATLMAMKSLSGSTYELLIHIDSQRHRENATERIVHYAAAAWYRP